MFNIYFNVYIFNLFVCLFIKVYLPGVVCALSSLILHLLKLYCSFGLLSRACPSLGSAKGKSRLEMKK